MNTERYYVVERITLDEAMDLHQAQDYAKAQARKYPSMQFHVLKSVGHTTQEVGWEWHNEQANKPDKHMANGTIMSEKSWEDRLAKLLHFETLAKEQLESEPITNDTQKYRMLEEGEERQLGDEFLFNGKWSKAYYLGKIEKALVGYYRRPISLDETEKPA